MVGQNHLTQSQLYTQVLNIWCNLLTTLLNVKTTAVRGQNGCKRNGVAAGALLLTTAQHLVEGPLHIASPGKGQTSQFQVQFLLNGYRFHTI